MLRGDLDDLGGLALAASAADGVVHLAFKHELNDMPQAAIADLAAVKAIGAALEGSDKPFVITSGTLLLAFAAPGRVGTEDDVLSGGPRADSENAVIAMADRGVRSSVIRLAPLVHSTLDHHGFTHRLIAIARESGVSGYVGDGNNRWSDSTPWMQRRCIARPSRRPLPAHVCTAWKTKESRSARSRR